MSEQSVVGYGRGGDLMTRRIVWLDKIHRLFVPGRCIPRHLLLPAIPVDFVVFFFFEFQTPELPISRRFLGAESPLNPTPCTITSAPLSSISTPISRKTAMVESTSSPRKISCTRVSPWARAPNIILR